MSSTMGASARDDYCSLLILSDDESLFQPALRELEGIESTFVHSACRAVSHFSSNPTDMVVVNLEAFPESGGECISIFRDLARNTFVIATFPADHRRQSLQALDNGADAVLIHPFYPRELAAMLRRGAVRVRAASEKAAAAAPGYGPVSAVAAGVSGLLKESISSVKDDLMDVIQGGAEGSGRVREAAREVRQEIDELGALAEQLRDYSYTSPPTHSAVDVNDLLEGLAEEIISASRQINVQKNLHAKTSVIWGDPDLLENALRYVIDERVRHIQTGGTLTVKTSTDDAENIELSIWDNGEPYTDREKQDLYEPFGIGSMKHPQTGLAFPIARGVARIHGGDVTVSSSRNDGTQARFIFPSRPPSDAARNSR